MKQMKIFIKKNFLTLLMLVVIFNVAAVGVTVAYFTSKPDTVKNSFSSGKVTIEIDEPNFDGGTAKHINPGQTIKKDPMINNIGTADAYVYAILTIPRANIKLVGDDDVSILPSESINLFNVNINDGWELISSDEFDYQGVYVYAYTKAIVKVGKSSDTLFDDITFVNVLEGQLNKDEVLSVNVDGLAIQSDGIDLIGSTTLEKMKYAYDTYLRG